MQEAIVPGKEGRDGRSTSELDHMSASATFLALTKERESQQSKLRKAIEAAGLSMSDVERWSSLTVTQLRAEFQERDDSYVSSVLHAVALHHAVDQAQAQVKAAGKILEATMQQMLVGGSTKESANKSTKAASYSLAPIPTDAPIKNLTQGCDVSPGLPWEMLRPAAANHELAHFPSPSSAFSNGYGGMQDRSRWLAVGSQHEPGHVASGGNVDAYSVLGEALVSLQLRQKEEQLSHQQQQQQQQQAGNTFPASSSQQLRPTPNSQQLMSTSTSSASQSQTILPAWASPNLDMPLNLSEVGVLNQALQPASLNWPSVMGMSAPLVDSNSNHFDLGGISGDISTMTAMGDDLQSLMFQQSLTEMQLDAWRNQQQRQMDQAMVLMHQQKQINRTMAIMQASSASGISHGTALAAQSGDTTHTNAHDSAGQYHRMDEMQWRSQPPPVLQPLPLQQLPVTAAAWSLPCPPPPPPHRFHSSPVASASRPIFSQPFHQGQASSHHQELSHQAFYDRKPYSMNLPPTRHVSISKLPDSKSLSMRCFSNQGSDAAPRPVPLPPHAAAIDPTMIKFSQDALREGLVVHGGGLASIFAAPTQHFLVCQICRVQCTSELSMDQHLLSKKHLSRAARIATLEAESSARASGIIDASDPFDPNLEVPCTEIHTLCKQVITPELNRAVLELLVKIRDLQNEYDSRVKEDDVSSRQEAALASGTASAQHKWYVSGLKEVKKAMKLGGTTSIILAANIEQFELANGNVDHEVAEILELGAEKGLPVVFALTRKRLGLVYGSYKLVSAIAVMDVGSAEEQHNRVVELMFRCREEWRGLQQDKN